jgi:hypothetical protein
MVERMESGVTIAFRVLVALSDASALHGTLPPKVVSHIIMRTRWQVILPIIGLILFGVESYSSFRFNRQLGTTPRRFYYWSSIRLDSAPLHKPCKPEDMGCGWEQNWVWIDSGYVAKFLMLPAIPAFAFGAIVVGALAHLGVSEVWSFGIVMPVSVFAWFYFVGWLIDRWILKRSHPSAPTPG